ncbi:LamG-like jellyroll fold domain-containing protein [Micromonospora taraxaci]|uniref:LamG-like jellyroll fold domain-containing protein n=1 Tax=Micromonospora taraxaci TaxID=1316803 RepID=UPI00339FC7F6
MGALVGARFASRAWGVSRRRTAALALLVVAAAGLVVPSGAGAAEAVTPAARSQASGPLEAADEASAMLLAHKVRKPVLVTGMTTQTSMEWAQPDGTFRAQMHSAPERVQAPAGEWVPVDLTLERKSDGSVGSKAGPFGLWLSGPRSAASDALVAIGEGAKRSTLGWLGALPEPTLDGATATYPNVKPDVDLVVQARPTGVSYSFVVKTPQAAVQMTTVAMPWSPGSALRAGARTGTAEEPVTVSQGEMWDSRVSPGGEPLYRADVDVADEVVDGRTSLVLRTDEAFYQDPHLQFPITIDPTINLNPSFDTYVQNTIANTDKSGDDELRLGYSDDADEGCASGCLARSFLAFYGLSAYAGATVVSAELSLWNYYSWQCAAAEWQTWRVDSVGSAVRWGSQPVWREIDGRSTGTKGYNSGCAGGRVSASVKNTFQISLNGGYNTANVGLRASSETSHTGWKKFKSFDAPSARPYVTLIFNRTPNVPTALAVDSCYSACQSPAVVRSGRPTLSAAVSDPDGGTLRAEYEVYDNAKTTLKAKSGTSVTGVTSGTARPWRVVPASGNALPDGTYHYRVRGCDTYTCGGYSGWFTFTVNTQDPSLPTVTGTPYSELSSGTWNGGAGTAGSFTFAPNGGTDVQEYLYSLNNTNTVTVPAGAPQGQKLTSSQQQVTDLSGFVGLNSTIARDTTRGHAGGDSLKVTPLASGGTSTGPQGDTFAAVGGDYGAMRLGMQAGKRYSITGWINVPSSTGLNVAGTSGTVRGLRIVGQYKVGSLYVEVASAKASIVDGWQRLSLVMAVPTGATEAFIRLYNGFPTGQTSKAVYWDDLSLQEVTGTTTTATITPSRDYLNVLSVQSRNSAGATSDPRVYQFLVSPSDDASNWTFDQDPVGSSPSLPAGSSAIHSTTGVTPQAFARVGDKAVTLDGTGDLTTASPVLNTSHAAGFTAAAWVRLTDKTAPRTVVAQLGSTNSMFELGYHNDRDIDGDAVADEAWCFTINRSDSATAEAVSACTTEQVTPDEWVSLVGVYDKPTGEIRLYVNGAPSNYGTKVTVANTTDWSAVGALTFGRGFGNTRRWVGDIDDVHTAQRAWNDTEIDRWGAPA